MDARAALSSCVVVQQSCQEALETVPSFQTWVVGLENVPLVYGSFLPLKRTPASPHMIDVRHKALVTFKVRHCYYEV